MQINCFFNGCFMGFLEVELFGGSDPFISCYLFIAEAVFQKTNSCSSLTRKSAVAFISVIKLIIKHTHTRIHTHKHTHTHTHTCSHTFFENQMCHSIEPVLHSEMSNRSMLYNYIWAQLECWPNMIITTCFIIRVKFSIAINVVFIFAMEDNFIPLSN